MKAILVIDVDKEDIGREVNYINVKGGGMSYIVGTMGEDVRLRPLPEYRYTVEDTGLNPTDQILIQSGWNDCLDEIMGETDESHISD